MLVATVARCVRATSRFSTESTANVMGKCMPQLLVSRLFGPSDFTTKGDDTYNVVV